MLNGNNPKDDSMAPRAYRARWIVPVSRPPIEDGIVAVQGGKIVFAGERRGWHEPVIDLGDVAILPGLVNAHTHLEFSEIAAPFGERGEDFAKWIPLVVYHRIARGPVQQEASVDLGLLESKAKGVVVLGEIATTEKWPESRDSAYVNGVIFQEFLGWDRAAIPTLLDKARSFLAANTADRWQRGLSPHAPYTVHRELLAGLCDAAVEHDAPVAMHLAESPAEMEFLATGQGPLRAMLEAAGVWQQDFWQTPISTLQILEQLARAKRALVIHGNELQTPDWEFLAERRARISVVYCPRTRDFFFPEQTYPLEQMLQRGVSVAIGTDSRASNPDLSLWRELQFIAQHHKLAPEEILRLGTEQGAVSLGFAATHGRLEAGHSAAMCVVRGVSLNITAQQLPERLLTPASFAEGFASSL
jgi:cytosine/adenosine deaminase-related metal-dependent hydrolase